MNDKITILFNSERKITLMYTLYPFWISKYKRKFDFSDDLNWVINKDQNKILILVGWLPGQKDRESKVGVLKNILRNKYKTIVFFEDNASTESNFFDLLPFVDLFYKKQIYTDKKKYLQNYYGNRSYSDYYHKKMNVIDEPLEPFYPRPKNLDEMKKFRLYWNLAFGQYPLSNIKNQLTKKLFNLFGSAVMPFIQSKFPYQAAVPRPTISKCQARFDHKGVVPSIGYQRKYFIDIVKNQPNFLTGRIPLKEYNKEVKNVKAILSPYGWGEICFRDFEAIFNGSVLLKPSMEHIETWPNLYQPNITYIPIDWDGSDIVEKVDLVLQDELLVHELTTNAWNELKNSYSIIDSKIDSIIEEIRSL
jgi:hypothetical protein